MSTLYKEELLEHYKDPQNFGELEGADVTIEEHNPLCGDQQKWFVKLDGDTVDTVRFTGDGCAISMAAASMLSEHIKGKTLEEIKNMTQEDMIQLIGTQVSPARMKCLLLSLHAVQKISS